MGYAGLSLAQEEDIQIVTGELPPYAYTQDEQIQGIATAIVKELMTRTGYQEKIEVKPWARTIQESTQGLQFSYPVARLPYREAQYQWIGPILDDTFAFAMLASDTRTFADLESLRDLTVGVNRGAPTEQRLQELGFPNLRVTPSEITNAKMLLNNRFDAWYTTKLMITHTMKLLEEDESQLKIAFSDLEVKMYLVASLDVPEEVVQEWQAQLDAMKADGTYNALLAQYGIQAE